MGKEANVNEDDFVVSVMVKQNYSNKGRGDKDFNLIPL
jgi:hypothetical protein